MHSVNVQTTVVTAATIGELAGLIETFGARRHEQGFPWELFVADSERTRTAFAVTGVGVANAASSAAALLHIFAPDLMINTGCAGAYGGTGLVTGDLALATTETFADLGATTPRGWLSLEGMGLPLLQKEGGVIYNEIPLAGRTSRTALTLAQRHGIQLCAGKFLTVSACSGTASRGAELRDRFGGICENMEGAAAALVAARYGVDFIEVRGISNLVEDRDLSRWDIPRAVAAARPFIEILLRELRQ